MKVTILFTLLFIHFFGYSQEAESEKLRDLNHYNKVENYVKEGEYGWYYANGQLSAVTTYKDNKLHGVAKKFYKKGSVKRIENYENGNFIDGKCFDEQGNEIPFFEFESKPEFPGGKSELYKFIAINFRKTVDVKGKIIVQFVVDTTGFPVDIKVIKGIHPDLDKEAVRVIKSLPKFKPGMQDRIPVRVLYSLPLSL